MFISLAINPTTYIVIFLLLGVVLKSKRWKRLCLTLSALLFLLFSNGALYQWIAEQWYKEYDRPLPERKQYTYGIVLGGYSYWDWKRSRPEFSEIADRLLEGMAVQAWTHPETGVSFRRFDHRKQRQKRFARKCRGHETISGRFGHAVGRCHLGNPRKQHVGKRNVHVRADR